MNGIDPSGNQCVEPSYEQFEKYLLRMEKLDSLKEVIPVNFDGDRAIYGSCTANSFCEYHIKRSTLQYSVHTNNFKQHLKRMVLFHL